MKRKINECVGAILFCTLFVSVVTVAGSIRGWAWEKVGALAKQIQGCS